MLGGSRLLLAVLATVPALLSCERAVPAPSVTQGRVRSLVSRAENLARRLSARSLTSSHDSKVHPHGASSLREAYFAAMERHLKDMENLLEFDEDSEWQSSGADEVGEARDVSPARLEMRGLREHWLVRREQVKIVEKLGEGQEGNVFRARYRGMSVVAKILKNQQAFAHEVAVLSQLRHPNLVQFLGACLDHGSGPQFILTEYCQGGSLEDLFASRQGSWDASVATVHKWAQELALALCCLHEQSPTMIHRDLKPSNLLLTADGRLKLADFGLAKYKSGDGGGMSAQPYRMTGFTGTLRYMAPEVVRCEESYDEKVDIYSFGLVLWGMCTGELPLQDKTRDEFIQAAALSQDWQPDVDRIAFAPLKDLMEMCWDKVPGQRPTAEAVLTLLQQMEEQVIRLAVTCLCLVYRWCFAATMPPLLDDSL